MGVAHLLINTRNTTVRDARETPTKGEAPRYTRGDRRGVLGPIEQPEVLVAGLYRDADLVVVGRSVPLTSAQSAELAAVLRPAKSGHPWPDEISSQRWSGRDPKKPLTKVAPVVVAEVTADAAMQAGQARHPLRFVRVRADLAPDDPEPLA